MAYMKRYVVLFLPLLLIPVFSFAAEPPTEPVMVRIHDTSGKTLSTFYPLGENYYGRASYAHADLNDDGNDEIIIGAGASMDPIVRIFSQDGALLHEFTAYHPNFRLGLHVAACDLDQDGSIEVITGAGHGGGPHVRVFNLDGTLWQNLEFFAYDADFRGGAHVACGDFDNDGDQEIATGPGITGGPHLKLFNTNGSLEDELFVGSLPSNSGLQLRTANVDQAGGDELIATEVQDGSHYLFVIGHDGNQLAVRNFSYLGDSLTNVSVSPYQFPGSSLEVLVNSGYTDASVSIRNLSANQRAGFSPFNTPGHGSQTHALLRNNELVQISINDSGNHRLNTGQHILVDISDQRLYAFEHSVLRDTFLISSGLPQYETPRGMFDIMAKLPTHTYRWVYGENDSRNYEIPNVKWNLRFKRHFYIHSANWHNNFGEKMSHGCVNVHQDNAERLFKWATDGARVEIVD